MKRRLSIRPEAEADLAEAFAWYEERRAGLGGEFLKEVRAVLDAVAEFPLQHSVIYRDVRRALPRRFPIKCFTSCMQTRFRSSVWFMPNATLESGNAGGRLECSPCPRDPTSDLG